jgi:hypothetical protein
LGIGNSPLKFGKKEFRPGFTHACSNGRGTAILQRDGRHVSIADERPNTKPVHRGAQRNIALDDGARQLQLLRVRQAQFAPSATISDSLIVQTWITPRQ